MADQGPTYLLEAGLDEHVQWAPRRRPIRNLLSFVWAFVAVALSIGSWSISTPLGAAPDEPDQTIQAAAAVRGQLHDYEFELRIRNIPLGRVGAVLVPQWVANTSHEASCFAKRPGVPASCSRGVGNETTPVVSATQISNYPPLYYLSVGVPSLLATGSGALYGMQYLAALLDALLIALGLFLLARYHPRRLPLLGAVIALSPMVLFIAAVVNASGMETAAAFCAWCGGLCLVERTVVPKPLAVWTSLAFVVLMLSRPISPANAAVIIVVLATLVGWTRSRALLSERSFRPLWISVLGAAVIAGISFAIIGIPSLLGVAEQPRLTFLGSVWLTLRLTGDRLRQCIGNFGWLDTPAPKGVIIIWALVLVGILTYGLAVSSRGRRALPLLFLAIVAMPVIFESPQINTVGPYWQGRYWLPLAVGLPLVASCVGARRVSQGARAAISPQLQLAGFLSVGSLLIVAQLTAFLTALHRYETGLGAKAGTPVTWTPPGGTDLVVCLFLAGQLLLLGFLTWTYLDKHRLEMSTTTGADAFRVPLT